MKVNQAAFQPYQGASTLEIKNAPYPSAHNGEIVIRNATVALNIMDTRIQSRGNMINTYLKYPFVLGYDMAGEIVEVGEDVTDLNINDRILALSRAGDKAINDPAQGAFQKCAIAFQDFTTKLPPNIDYAHAAVIPLSVITAAAALFDSTQLGLELPVVPKRSATGQTVLIWGGSTSVGCSAIQLAVSARYEVFATAGLKNQKKLRELGATKIWDYSSRTAVKDIVAALSGKELAGIVSIGSGAANKCIDIVKSVE